MKYCIISLFRSLFQNRVFVIIFRHLFSSPFRQYVQKSFARSDYLIDNVFFMICMKIANWYLNYYVV